MNIKEHIEAGHYTEARNGLPVVRTRSGAEALIVSTHYHHPDFPSFCILAILPHKNECQPFCWSADGGYHGMALNSVSPLDLMPPPPRKQTYEVYMALWTDGVVRDVTWAGKEGHIGKLERWRESGQTVVKLTGECDVPWEEADAAG